MKEAQELLLELNRLVPPPSNRNHGILVRDGRLVVFVWQSAVKTQQFTLDPSDFDRPVGELAVFIARLAGPSVHPGASVEAEGHNRQDV